MSSVFVVISSVAIFAVVAFIAWLVWDNLVVPIFDSRVENREIRKALREALDDYRAGRKFNSTDWHRWDHHFTGKNIGNNGEGFDRYCREISVRRSIRWGLSQLREERGSLTRTEPEYFLRDTGRIKKLLEETPGVRLEDFGLTQEGFQEIVNEISSRIAKKKAQEILYGFYSLSEKKRKLEEFLEEVGLAVGDLGLGQPEVECYETVPSEPPSGEDPKPLGMICL